jgi:pyruvate-formate lyase-activating enzyme
MVAILGLLRYGQGFHEVERHEAEPYRWMADAGVLELDPAAEPRFLEMEVRGIAGDLEQRLSADAGDGAREAMLVEGWNTVSVPLPAACGTVRLATDRALSPEARAGDERVLALRVRKADVHGDAARHSRAARRHDARLAAARTIHESLLGAYRRTAAALRLVDGFHGIEVDEGQAYRWMARRARIALPPAEGTRFLELQVRSPYQDLSAHLAAGVGADWSRRTLGDGWSVVSFVIAPGTDELRLEADRPLPASARPGDARDLAVQVRWPLLHDDPVRHAHVERQHENRVRNRKELLEGAIRLESTPWKLGIDMVGACNVKPPCVYCNWDEAKRREGPDVDTPFDLQTLRAYGPFFENASELVNCSIGEPFMMREVDDLLDAFGTRGKLLELTTNGQILTDANIRKLLGRNAHLYISLDAATPETYARLRNDTFPRLLENVRRLVEAKGGRGQLPLVYLVFMPMRANVHEVDAFVELCAQLSADRLVLRPLNAGEGMDLVWDRAGRHFDYQRELLPFEELVRVSGRVAEMCRRLGVPLSDQMDFGGQMAEGFADLFAEGVREGASVPLTPATQADSLPTTWGVEAAGAAAGAPPPGAPVPTEQASEGAAPESPRLPVCTEPWTSLYVLRRGTLPCCYGGPVLAPMASFQEQWNGPLIQEIRRELRDGRFHAYCFDSPDCPIVRKASEGRELPPGQAALLLARRGLSRLRRAGSSLLKPAGAPRKAT